jgi:hypothetical protein
MHADAEAPALARQLVKVLFAALLHDILVASHAATALE